VWDIPPCQDDGSYAQVTNISYKYRRNYVQYNVKNGEFTDRVRITVG